MRKPLEKILRGTSGPLLLLAESGESVSGVLVRRVGEAWECEGETLVASPPGPAAIAEILSRIDAGKVSRAVLASARCGLLVHPSAVPAGLSEEAAAEMLRWEIDFGPLASAESGGTTELATAWRIGHAPAGGGQSAVAAVREADLAPWQEALASRSIELAAVLPAHSLGYALLDRSVRREGNAIVALALRWEGGEALSVFERGKLEFHADYPAGGEGWSRSLVADARSFAPERFLAAGEVPGEEEALLFSTPSLPPTEWLRGGEDWPWSGLLAALELALADANEPFPCVFLAASPVPVHARPLVWWAAAILLVAALSIPLALKWQGQIQELNAKIEHHRELARASAQRLESFEGDATEYEALESELRSLEERAERAESRRHRPVAAHCATVDYLSAAMRSLSTAFVGPVRLLRFQTDFEGRLAFGGETATDADAQEALGRFYAAMEGHPILPSPLSTTREGAPPGRFHFLAEHAALAVVEAEPAATPIAPGEVPATEGTDETPLPTDTSAPLASEIPAALTSARAAPQP